MSLLWIVEHLDIVKDILLCFFTGAGALAQVKEVHNWAAATRAKERCIVLVQAATTWAGLPLHDAHPAWKSWLALFLWSYVQFLLGDAGTDPLNLVGGSVTPVLFSAGT